MTLLEVCIDDFAGLEAARSGGAARLELCSALGLGGLTPSPGLMAMTAKSGMDAVAMIRPRAGDFVGTEAEVAQMEAEIDAVRGAGIGGVVLGASLPDGRLDEGVLARLCRRAEGLVRVLHRAFDLTPDPIAALEGAVSLGFDRILTSGGARTCIEGQTLLAELVKQAAGRIAILPGGGLTVENVRAFLREVQVPEVHASCALPVPVPVAAQAMGFGRETRPATDAARVAAMVSALGAERV